MNTPGHAIVNLALFGKRARKHSAWIVMGAIVADLPIFLFYAIQKLRQMPEKKIWGELYFQPQWQIIVDTFHSIPLAAIGLLICVWAKKKQWSLFCASLIFHSLFDLPVHHDDAHRHFYPFSDYQFHSPVSYWDPNHYGNLMAPLEMLMVLGLSLFLWKDYPRLWQRGFLVAVNLMYASSYLFFYWFGSF